MIKIILGVLLLISGCASDAPTQEVSEEFSVIKDIEQDILAKFDSKLYFPEEIHGDTKKAVKVYTGLKNTHNKTVCFYLQPTCRVVLGGLDCDSKTMSENTDYYWDWFYLPKSVLMKPLEKKVIKGKVVPKGSQDTYLGKLAVWEREPTGNSCPKIQYYNEKKDLKLYAKQDFQFILG